MNLFPKPMVSALLCFAVLTGCSTGNFDYESLGLDTSATVASISPTPLPQRNVGAPRFEDSKPHEWGRMTPWHYPVHGTDVSKYQGMIDWARVRDSGISFAFIKATEGGDHLDEAFSRNWRGTAEVGVMRGAYHFYYWCRKGSEQANWFIRNVPKDSSALPPVLDLEWNSESKTCATRPPREEVHKQVGIFLSMVEAHYGKRPIIYTTVDFFDENNMAQLKGYNFWLRSVAGHPEEKYGPHPWMFWQYTGTGAIPGIVGKADINVFHGSRDAWKQLVAPLQLNAYSR